MPLAESDVARLEATGLARDAFTERGPDGILRLRNVASTSRPGRSHCVFLAEGRCTVHALRPDGCRSYPIVLSADSGRAVRDVDCPWRAEFAVEPSAGRRLRALWRRIEHEGQR